MWQTIFTASLLDYTICFVTGEVIYSIAYKVTPSDDTLFFYYILTTLTIILAASLMWCTQKLSKSLILSIGFFILGYNIINV